MTEEKNLSMILESILFVHGEPLALARLAALARASEEETRAGLATLAKNLDGRGLVLLEKDGAWQLGSHPVSAPFVEALARDQFGEELSRASLETLAIMAYKGPISRANIEYIRGVNSSFTLRALLMRGLAERTDDQKDGRGFQYRVGIDFLKHLGLTNITDLPQYAELSKTPLHSPASATTDTDTLALLHTDTPRS